MSIEIKFCEKDAAQLRENHNENIVERLISKIKTKNDTLQWKDTIEGCTERFYTTIKQDGETFPIIQFAVNTTEYRCILCWIPEYEEFEFIKVVGKEDSYPNSFQRQIEDKILKHPTKVKEEAKESLTEKHTTDNRNILT